MAPVPDTIKVGPFHYMVEQNRHAINHASVTSGEVLLGQCDHDHLVIRLSPDMPRERAAEVLLHETLHAITHLTGAIKDLGYDIEEAMVNRVAPALLAVLRENPDLVDVLLDRRRDGNAIQAGA